eukprot:1183711-Amphidinium_carterae.1
MHWELNAYIVHKIFHKESSCEEIACKKECNWIPEKGIGHGNILDQDGISNAAKVTSDLSLRPLSLCCMNAVLAGQDSQETAERLLVDIPFKPQPLQSRPQSIVPPNGKTQAYAKNSHEL